VQPWAVTGAPGSVRFVELSQLSDAGAPRRARLVGVEPREAGLASGLINSSQQIGGALGVAIAATVAFTHTKTLLASGDSAASAATGGFALGFWVLAGVSAASVVACLLLVRGQELEQTATT